MNPEEIVMNNIGPYNGQDMVGFFKTWATEAERKKKEIEEVLELFDRLLAKYNTLITGEGFSTFYPTPNYDWRTVLQIPWMSSYPRQKPPHYTGPKQ